MKREYSLTADIIHSEWMTWLEGQNKKVSEYSDVNMTCHSSTRSIFTAGVSPNSSLLYLLRVQYSTIYIGTQSLMEEDLFHGNVFDPLRSFKMMLEQKRMTRISQKFW